MVSSVMQKFRTDERTYILDLVFGFVILPEHTGFSHSVVLEASSADIGKTEKYLEWARSCSWRSPFVQRGEVFDILCHLGSIEIRHCGNSALWFHQPFFLQLMYCSRGTVDSRGNYSKLCSKADL